MPDEPQNELLKQGLQSVGDLLKRIAGPLADEVGESLGVVARHYRFRLALKMLQKTQRMLREADIAPRAVPPRLFLPIMEGASIVAGIRQNQDGYGEGRQHEANGRAKRSQLPFVLG